MSFEQPLAQWSSRQMLNSLLLQNTSRFNIEYGGYLSNHLSHGLIALYKLGAPANRLRSFYDRYTTHTRLEPAVPPDPHIQITERNIWDKKSILGRSKYFTNLLQYFENEFFKRYNNSWKKEEENTKSLSVISDLINDYYPKMSEGLCGAAFHALIQLGYGLEVMNEKTILEGLAYSIYAFKSLGKISDNPCVEPLLASSSTSPVSMSTFDEQLLYCLNVRVRCHPTVQKIINDEFERQERFQSRMAHLAKNYVSLLQSFDLKIEGSDDENRLNEFLISLWLTAVKTYASSNDQFFILHLVTGSRAFQQVFKHLRNAKDKKLALQYVWKAFVAAYICVDCPELNPEKWEPSDPDEVDNLPEWDTIISKAIEEPGDDEGEDEHKIKLVMTCYENEKELGTNPLYRLVAGRKVGLIPW
jgi:hypothetical protein